MGNRYGACVEWVELGISKPIGIVPGDSPLQRESRHYDVRVQAMIGVNIGGILLANIPSNIPSEPTVWYLFALMIFLVGGLIKMILQHNKEREERAEERERALLEHNKELLAHNKEYQRLISEQSRNLASLADAVMQLKKEIKNIKEDIFSIWQKIG